MLSVVVIINVSIVQKDYLSKWDQVYYWPLCLQFHKNITTIYKHNYMKYKHKQMYTNIFTITKII
jgi:hypothetical protein